MTNSRREPANLPQLPVAVSGVLEAPVQRESNRPIFILLTDEERWSLISTAHRWRQEDMAYPREDMERHLAEGGALTPATLAVIANLLMGGMSLSGTRRAAGLLPKEWDMYYLKGRGGQYPEVLFRKLVDMSTAAVEASLVKTWVKAATEGYTADPSKAPVPDWRAAQALLAARTPEEYSKTASNTINVTTRQATNQTEAEAVEVPTSLAALGDEGLLAVAAILEAAGALKAMPQDIEGEEVPDDDTGDDGADESSSTAAESASTAGVEDAYDDTPGA